MKECNHCDRRHCQVSKLLREDLESPRPVPAAVELARESCSIHIPPPSFKVPLVVLGLWSNAQGVNEVLQAADMRLEERPRYPWYKVKLNKGRRLRA